MLESTLVEAILIKRKFHKFRVSYGKGGNNALNIETYIYGLIN